MQGGRVCCVRLVACGAPMAQRRVREDFADRRPVCEHLEHEGEQAVTSLPCRSARSQAARWHPDPPHSLSSPFPAPGRAQVPPCPGAQRQPAACFTDQGLCPPIMTQPGGDTRGCMGVSRGHGCRKDECSDAGAASTRGYCLPERSRDPYTRWPGNCARVSRRAGGSPAAGGGCVLWWGCLSRPCP